jgi:type II secretory pathway pseudopilin PulG
VIGELLLWLVVIGILAAAVIYSWGASEDETPPEEEQE